MSQQACDSANCAANKVGRSDGSAERRSRRPVGVCTAEYPIPSKVQVSSTADHNEMNFVDMSCCKVCTGGKACGDSCIGKTETCTKPGGCACNGA